jgi:hypothetical protein
MLYLISDDEGYGEGVHVKIGFTTDVEERLRTLQTGNPKELNIQGLFNGDRDTEKELHELFEAFHVRGEWYRYCTPFVQLMTEWIESKQVTQEEISEYITECCAAEI